MDGCRLRDDLLEETLWVGFGVERAGADAVVTIEFDDTPCGRGTVRLPRIGGLESAVVGGDWTNGDPGVRIEGIPK